MLQAFHDKWPEARIAWLVKDIYLNILEDNALIDELILLKRNSLTTSIWSFRQELRKSKFDLAVDMSGLFRSGLIARLSGAPLRIGFSDAREFATIFYTHKVDAPRSLHAVDRNLKLAALPECDTANVKFPLKINQNAIDEISEFIRKNNFGSKRPIVTLVPGGRWYKKRWPAGLFSKLGDLLSRELNANIIVTGSKKEEMMISNIRKGMKSSSLEAVGFPLQKLVALIIKSDVVVTNDSGPIHISAAAGTPVVALFGPTDPERTGPYTKNSQKRIVIQKEMNCIPCFRKPCVHDSFVCMESITPEEVLEGVKEILK